MRPRGAPRGGRRSGPAVVLASLSVLAWGCAGTWREGEEDGLVVLHDRRGSGPNARVVLEVDVVDEDALLLTSVLDPDVDGYLASITDPTGEVVYDAERWWEDPHGLTNAGFASDVIVAQWPILADHDPLAPGTWSLEVVTEEGFVPVDTTVLLKRDPVLAAGRLRVEVVFAADLERDPPLVDGIEAAMEVVATGIYGPAGIEVSVEERAWDGVSGLESPGFGDRDAYLQVTGDKPLRAVTVVIVRRVTDVVDVLGVAGGIPGPLVPTDRSVVTISAEEGAGVDLVFSDGEVRLMAETIAHEIGHFLGLFHPVELPTDASGTVEHWDALDDTPTCARFDACAALLGQNLMFPTPLCGGDDPETCELVLQEHTTADQRGVLQRYVGVE